MAFEVFDSCPYDICTYFIQVAPHGPIKIGRSVDPSDRFQAIQAFIPFPLIPLLILPGNHERELHRAFDPYRINGEWFQPVSCLTKFIGQVIPAAPDYIDVGGRRTVIGRECNRVEIAHLARQLTGPTLSRKVDIKIRSSIRQRKQWIRNVV